jgi:hypothetical protein
MNAQLLDKVNGDVNISVNNEWITLMTTPSCANAEIFWKIMV